MIHENIAALRRRAGLSQEAVAERVGVSRQTVAKWESGESAPDIARAGELAQLFSVSLDDLVNTPPDAAGGIPPRGKYMFGIVTIGERGQIVIPARARQVFGLKPGDELLVLGDIGQGIALCRTEFFLQCYEEMQKKERDRS